MTPQSSFMILAAIEPTRERELRARLASMNDGPGRLKRETPLVPFTRFATLHVARFVILDDQTVGDIRAYGRTPAAYPLYLAFIGDIDGNLGEFLEDLAAIAASGLRALFACCRDFSPTADLVEWMRARNVRPAANYVNWVGRTVRQIREEAALHQALVEHAERQANELAQLTPRQAHAFLHARVREDVTSGRLRLSAESPTPWLWRLGNILHLIGVPLAAVLVSPLLLIVALVGAIRLRQLEKTDPERCERTDPAYALELASLEDHDVTNPFSAMGSVKPGWLRLAIASVVLIAINYAARHIYTRGRLARVRTIHFARWVFIDRKQRILFLSNYDGSLESYMDDFINKVGFGLNVVFSNGVGYPRTTWLVAEGCRDERKFKEFLRRHQLPTQVWYKAYPGLTTTDLERNLRIRRGVTSTSLTDDEARGWLALL